MTPAQWEMVKELFDEALEQEEESRSRLLAGVDPIVVSEVRRLIGQYEKAGDFLETPASMPVIEEVLAGPRFKPDEVVASRYTIVNLLGEGGMGEVYLAQDGELDARVALKTVRPGANFDLSSQKRLRREVLLARRITHPNVCRIFDAGRHCAESRADLLFFTMEYLAGEPLSARIKRVGAIDPATLLPIALDVCAALEAAHTLGIVHRDLKPSNVMLADGRAVVMDFGLAISRDPAEDSRNPSTALTNPGQLLGTLEYMAPEQIRGQPSTSASDIYSLGVMLFEALAGERPYRAGSSVEEMLKRFLDPSPPVRARNPSVPASWDALIRQCLAVEPGARPSSAGEVASRLRGRDPFRMPLLARRTILAAGAVVSLSYAGYRYLSSKGPAAVRGAKLVVAGEWGAASDFAAAETQMTQSLQQSGQIRLWNPKALPQVLAAMGRSDEEPLTPAIWREVALREGQHFVVFVSGSEVGEGYSFSVRLEQVLGDPARSWKAWQNSFQAHSKDQILRSVDDAAIWLRETLGEPAAEIAESAAPERVTTPSWPALREFHAAERLIAGGKRREAIAHLDAALRHDPQFTMALYRKGDLHVSLSENEAGYRAWLLALESSKQRPLSKREDLKLRGMLASDTADYQTAERLFREYSQRFPEEMYGHYYRISPLQFLGRNEESLVAVDASAKFGERKHPVLMHRLFGLLPLGRFDEARVIAGQLDADGAKEWAQEARGMTAFVQGQSKEALDRYEAAAKLAEPQRASQMRLYQAFILADAGETERAIRHLREGERADAIGFRAERAQKLLSIAALEMDRGETRLAVEAARGAIEIERSPLCLSVAAEIFAQAGEVQRAQSILDGIAKLDIHVYVCARNRAASAIALARRDFAAALRFAQAAAAADAPGWGKYYLAQALAAVGNNSEALDEAQRALRYKAYQIRQTYPEPAGYWYRTIRFAEKVAVQSGDPRLQENSALKAGLQQRN